MHLCTVKPVLHVNVTSIKQSKSQFYISLLRFMSEDLPIFTKCTLLKQPVLDFSRDRCLVNTDLTACEDRVV